MKPEDIIVYVVTAVIGCFVAYLFKRLEKRDEENKKLTERVAALEITAVSASSTKEDMQELKKDVKELRDSLMNLRIDIAKIVGNKDA